MEQRMRLALILALLVAGCAGGLQPMDWPVRCEATTVAELDRRFADETAPQPATDDGVDVTYASPLMFGCDPLQGVAECPEYHRVWRRYWQARRELAACAQASR